MLPGNKAKNIFLACSSIVFYSFGQLVYLPLFLLSVLINYISGRLLCSAEKGRRLILSASVVLNLGILGVFKYTDFLIENINALFSLSIPAAGIVLPIGISFFTFQGMSYVIDTYRDKSSGTKNFVKVLLYISFFPQLIAGPIVKYHDIALQIDERVSEANLSAAGIRRFILGLGKKIIFSNAAGYIADQVFNVYLPSGSLDMRLAWLGGICYSLQIYYDFSGYSDMAIGIGKMFGFHFLENFNYPYSSVGIVEFWRRWHISLSSWFKEYLYIPLGGNRKGRLRTAINKLTVFFCTGIWHGANWTFVVWGMCHGLLSSLESSGVIPVKKLSSTAVGRLLCRIYTLLAVMLLFVIFRADSLGDGFRLIGAMFSAEFNAAGAEALTALLNPAAVVTLLISVFLCTKRSAAIRDCVECTELSFTKQLVLNCCCIIVYLLCVFSLARGGFNPFIYFQF